MELRWILTALLQECLTISLMSPGVHILSPSGVYLSYLRNSTSYAPSLEGLLPAEVTEQHRGLQQRNFSCTNVEQSRTAEHGVLCIWEEKITEDAGRKKTTTPEESHPIDHTWQLQCFMRENTTQITCEIQYVTVETLMGVGFIPRLYYTRNDEEDDRMEAACRCQTPEHCDCRISPAVYNESYVLWMEIVDAVTSLRSPPMLLQAAAIIKPRPPSDLRAEITSDGKIKVLWSSSTSSRLQCQVKHYVSSTEEIAPPSYEVVDKNYVTLDVPESCAPLVFEVRCRRFPALGVWSNWTFPIVLKSKDGYYFPRRVVVSSGSSVSVFCMFCDKDEKVPSTAITWGLNLADQIPPSQYTAVSTYVGKVTIDNLNTTTPKGKFQFDALYCCIRGIVCHPRYAEIYVIDTNISITCETNGQYTAMTCRWTPKQIIPLNDISVTFRYYMVLNSSSINFARSSVQSCERQPDASYQCIFHRPKTFCIYYMWVEMEHPSGTLRSPPVSVKPSEVVKPLPPLMLRAEVVDAEQDARRFHVTWRRPRFVFSEVFYQLRYRLQGPETEWQVVDTYNEESADILGACQAYTIQVRSHLVTMSDIWSDWSNAINTTVKDIKEPLRGPEFWRITPKNNIQKGDNITLVWKPLQKEESLCSVRGYEVVQKVSNILISSKEVGNVTNYTLTLQHSKVTVSVRAINSYGPSKISHNLTLSEDMSAVKAVKSLDVYALNKTVLAVWKMSPVPYDLLGVVLEWKNLGRKSQTRWTYIPPNISRYYIKDHIFAIEKYEFRLTPVFSEGVGSSIVTYEISTEDEMQNRTGLYIMLPVLTATSFLLVITVAISRQRMKRLLWKEVPNPKYCSWAQGVNFQKIH